MINRIFEILNLNKENGLIVLNESDWKGQLPQRTENIIENIIKPHALFLFNNEPFIIFFDNPTNEELIFKQCWNLNQTPIIFIIRDDEVEIYNGLSYIKGQKAKQLPHDNWKNDFSFFNIISGKTWAQISRDEFNKNRVDEKLLQNIKAVRDLLKKEFELPNQAINSLIGRLIFIRYLIDRNVVIGFSDENSGKLTNESLCKILKSPKETYRLFSYIKEKFNGNLFPVSEEELKSVSQEHLAQLINLLRGTEISSGQMSLFDVYDFSIIPVELISNVYEFFIGQAEQETKGAYYTPLFLVNNILSETINTFFTNNPKEYNCKILDPACGSGVFLVESLRKIISQYQKNNPGYHTDLNKFKETIKQLLTDNIFGIDKDPNAVNVAIFSLYVTLLDYLLPPEIVEFRFPPLLNNNFFVDDFFDLDAQYNTLLTKESQRFNFIIGNPPWGKIDESVDLYEKYWKDREKAETKTQHEASPDYKGKVEIKVSRKEIAQVFLIRVSDFSFKECAFVITSKVLYNLNAKTFRTYFLNNFALRKVFEMSSVRHEVFDKSNDPATCPATVLYYSYSPDKEINKQNLVTHISLKPNRFFELFKLLTVEKHDQKQLFQSYFMENDWIWKVLVYGNILDFYLIKRLFGDKKLNKIINNKAEFIFGKGICINGGDENPTAELAKIPYFVNAQNKALKPFYVQYSTNEIGKLDFVHRPRNIELFRKPLLLVKKGISSDFKVVSATSEKDCIFTDAYTSIKAIKQGNSSFLKILSAIFNSSFFSYFMLSISSSLGIEREQGHDEEEKFSIPIPFDTNNISKNVLKKIQELEQIAKQLNESEIELSDRYIQSQVKYNELLCEIDKEIYNIYQINNQEKALIDFAHEVSIPLIKSRDSQRIFGALNLQVEAHKKYLTDYANIFIAHYNNIFNSDGQYFEVEVWHSAYMIGMYFKVIPEQSKAENQIVWKPDIETKDLLKKFTAISISKQSKDLFVQKDIKGFEAEAFYVVKPNEYKNWHRALAYMDLSEFIEAIMKAAREEVATS